jgi:hypothetical protein
VSGKKGEESPVRDKLMYVLINRPMFEAMGKNNTSAVNVIQRLILHELITVEKYIPS